MNTLRAECWAITDEAAGNQRQALALAEQMAMPVRHLVLLPRAPWSWLSPRMTFGGRLALPASQRNVFAPPWPQIAIGCGRGAALLTRLLRPLTDGRCRTVQILDPRINPSHWDIVIAPRHDCLSGKNVLTPLGSLNPVDDAWLEDGRAASPEIGDLPRPRVGVLLGGPRKGLRIDASYAGHLAHALLDRHGLEGGSLLVLASRRTPPSVMDVMRNLLAGIPGLYWTGPDDGSNPYPGVLGWADRLVVTPDSVNMLSEACAVGCAVYTLTAGHLPAKLARFHQSLREAGLLHEMTDESPARPQSPLRETEAIAAALRARVLAG